MRFAARLFRATYSGAAYSGNGYPRPGTYQGGYSANHYASQPVTYQPQNAQPLRLWHACIVPMAQRIIRVAMGFHRAEAGHYITATLWRGPGYEISTKPLLAFKGGSAIKSRSIFARKPKLRIV